MEIKTQRLLLRSFTEETYYSFSDQYEMGPHIEGYLKDLKGDPELQGWGAWLAIRQDNGKPVGDLGFKGKPDADGIVEVGYGIVSEEQGRGFATEAVSALLEWAFDTEKTRKAIAECLRDNTASIKVLQQLGMDQIGKDQEMIYWELSK